MNYKDKGIIEGQLFIIDPVNQMLVEEADRGNMLKYSQMESDGTFYNFYYNTERRCLVKEMPNSPRQTEQANIIRVKLKQDLANLESRSLDYSDEINKNSYRYGNRFIYLGKAFEHLVQLRQDYLQMNIGGVVYEIHADAGVLFKRSDGKTIEMWKLDKSTDSEGASWHQGYYNIRSEEVVSEKSAVANPKDTIFFRVPEMKVLDPVGTALKEGKVPYIYLNEFPVNKTQKAELLTLIESPLKNSIGLKQKPSGPKLKKRRLIR